MTVTDLGAELVKRASTAPEPAAARQSHEARRSVGFIVGTGLLLGACGPATRRSRNRRRSPYRSRRRSTRVHSDAVPRREPRSPFGNPVFYEVLGARYYVLAGSVGYRERGVASWYGPGFHQGRTSSGESTT